MVVLPFPYKTFPTPFHLFFIEIIDVNLLLYVQIEGEHRPEGGEVMAG